VINLIWVVIFGLIAGVIGKALMPGDDPGGIVVTALIGIAGAVIGFFVFRLIGIGDGDKFDLLGLPGAIIGVMLLLFAYRKFAGGRTGVGSGRTQARL